MVSKLLLAVQEVCLVARRAKAPEALQQQLAKAYARVRGGLGFNKSPQQFGAFPNDPYSHTPRHAGAQQPGMTGSVKEEILTRLGELGVEVREGRLHFEPWLLPRQEVLTTSSAFSWFDLAGVEQRQRLEAGQLGFTVCQVPVTYSVGAKQAVEVHWANGESQTLDGTALTDEASRAILGRSGAVRAVRVTILATELG